jgi:geranylgeranylglycerol-phosphate geranylgeranyltransferase
MQCKIENRSEEGLGRKGKVQEMLFKGPETQIQRKEDMMLAYLELLRPFNGLMSVFAVFIAAMLVGFPLSYQLLVAFLVVFLVSGAGMVINDYFDYRIDKVNRSKRPIPSGRVSRKNALIYSILLFAIANIAALYLNFYMFLLAAFNTFVTVVYSWKLKKKLLIGNIAVSWLVASTFFFGSLLKETLTATVLILFMLSFSSNLGREITKSIEDVKGDKKLKANTLPVLAGNNFAGWMACIFVLFTIIFSFMPYVLNLLSINYLIAVLIADVVFAASCFLILLSPKKAQKFMKIGMFIALLAFLAGVF